MAKKFKHLTWENRLQIERLLLLGYKPPQIAEVIGCCRATVYNEINRASYIHHSGDYWIAEKRYSPEIAEEKYRKMLKEKGRPLKVWQDASILQYLENKILNDKFSPAAALMSIKNDNVEFGVEIKSVNTVYSYIRKGIFKSLSMQDCPYREKKVRKKRVKRAKSAARGKSIEIRPEIVDDRVDFGHWEMDTVKGKQGNKKCLLVLTERKTRFEYIEVMKSCSEVETIRALNRIEKRLGSNFFKMFKTITSDNGVEFRDSEGIEKALYRVGKRTELYYCHPYCSCERASNENQNKLIRRHYPKGTDFDAVLDKKKVRWVQDWINAYPRKMFDGRCSEELFREELANLNIA